MFEFYFLIWNIWNVFVCAITQYRQLRARRALFAVQRCSTEDQKGAVAVKKSMAIVPFWFSMENIWTVITPFWLSTDNISSILKKSDKSFCRNHSMWGVQHVQFGCLSISCSPIPIINNSSSTTDIFYHHGMYLWPFSINIFTSCNKISYCIQQKECEIHCIYLSTKNRIIVTVSLEDQLLEFMIHSLGNITFKHDQ